MAADHGEDRGVPRPVVGGQGGGEGGGGVDGSAVDGGDDVAGLEAGLLGAGALGHILHRGPGGDAVALGVRGHGEHLDPQIGLAGDVAVLDDVGQQDLHIVDRQGEAQALGADAGGGLRILGGGDADDIAVAVEEGAAGVARVDGGVGLEHIEGGAGLAAVLIGAGGGDQPVQGGDDPVSEGVGQLAQGVADGVDALAHHQLVAVPQGDGDETAGLDLENGHVVVLLAPHQLGVVLVTIGEGHLDGHRAVVHRFLDHVVVGGDVAVLTEDESGARGGGGGSLPEDVHRGVHRDAHAGGQVGGVELLGGHGLAAVGVAHCLHLGAVLHLEDDGAARRELRPGGQLLVEPGPTHAGGAAHQGTGQQQRHHLRCPPLFLGGPGAGAEGGVRHRGDRVGVVPKAAPVAVVLAAVKIEFFHVKTLLSKRGISGAPWNCGYHNPKI